MPATQRKYIWRIDTGCGPTLYRKCHSHNTPGKRHNNTWVEPLAGNCTTSSTRQREQVWQKCKIQKNWCTVTVEPTIEYHGGHSRTPVNQRWDQVPGRSQRLLLGKYINKNWAEELPVSTETLVLFWPVFDDQRFASFYGVNI